VKLIIDSGSTKADWIFIDGEKTAAVSEGMNPCFLNEEKISAIIQKSVPSAIQSKELTEIFFYGAGCAELPQKKITSNAFSNFFPNAKITVDIDTMAAVRATCGSNPGIACIIGTGSNSIFFDGNKPVPNNYGLGFILADEGAGTYLGKKLITHYLYNILPPDLHTLFSKKYSLSREEAITRCYNTPNANAWLASYAVFLDDHKTHPWVINLISEGFDEFLHLYVMNYPSYEKHLVHFIGSIAYHHSEILKVVCKANNISTGKIFQKPIDGLIQYHK
jgi:glucosamine kinase